MSQEQVDPGRYDSDIIGDQIGEAVRSLYPGLTRLDKAFWYIVLAVDFGGAQYLVESAKINKGTAVDKFPLGWESINIAEEFLEGSIPAVIGAFAGKRVFELICSKFLGDSVYNKHSERMFMLSGASMGYGVMMQLGYLLEQHLGIPDIKWGPFK